LLSHCYRCAVWVALSALSPPLSHCYRCAESALCGPLYIYYVYIYLRGP
jgi:hypothetical protein